MLKHFQAEMWGAPYQAISFILSLAFRPSIAAVLKLFSIKPAILNGNIHGYRRMIIKSIKRSNFEVIDPWHYVVLSLKDIHNRTAVALATSIFSSDVPAESAIG